MSARKRWAVYRDRSPLSPVYLGDVLCDGDRDAAVREGAKVYGGAVVVHRSGEKPGHPVATVTPELERAVKKRESRGKSSTRGWRPVRGRTFREDGEP